MRYLGTIGILYDKYKLIINVTDKTHRIKTLLFRSLMKSVANPHRNNNNIIEETNELNPVNWIMVSMIIPNPCIPNVGPPDFVDNITGIAIAASGSVVIAKITDDIINSLMY